MGSRPLPRRGANAGDARGRARRGTRLRLPRSQWHGLHGHGAGARRDTGAAGQAQRAARRTAGRSPDAQAARWAGAGPCLALPPSRHQAGQHHRRSAQRPDADRFRRLARLHRRPDFGHDRGVHAALRRCRAAHLGRAGAVDRYLRAGRHAVFRGHRHAAADRPGEAAQGQVRAAERRDTRGVPRGSAAWHRCRPGRAGCRPAAIGRGLALLFQRRAGQRCDDRRTPAAPAAAAATTRDVATDRGDVATASLSAALPGGRDGSDAATGALTGGCWAATGTSGCRSSRVGEGAPGCPGRRRRRGADRRSGSGILLAVVAGRPRELAPGQ